MGKAKRDKSEFVLNQRHAYLDCKYSLYQRAVQSPKGDISWMAKFFREYIGGRAPLHLREDFCGSALVCVTWCKGDVFHSAVGLDLDPEPLRWGMANNAPLLGGGGPSQLLLLECNVLDDPATAAEIPHLPSSSGNDGSSTAAAAETEAGGEAAAKAGADADEEGSASLRERPADIVCALNFGVCLLHRRTELLQYFRRVRAALSPEGGVFVADLLGGHAAEAPVRLPRQNAVTGLHYVWEQGAFNPVTRRINSFITLKCPDTKQVMKHAFTYDWRLWTVLDVTELLLQAGFSSTHVWLRPMKEQDGGSGSEEEGGESGDEVEADFVPYTAALAADAGMLQQLSRGWTAYIVGVVAPPGPGG